MSHATSWKINESSGFFFLALVFDMRSWKAEPVALKYEAITTAQGLKFLRHCYWFVDKNWQQSARAQLPDQGFEINFRSSCVTELKDWQISQEVELGLGDELVTASGVRHEIDLVARHSDTQAIVELKNRPGCPPGKNDVVIFFAKILDFLAHNPKLMLSEVLPVFVSTCAFEEPTLAACLGLGIHPVAPGLRPLPILADNLNRIGTEIGRGFAMQDDLLADWDDVCAGLNRLLLGLDQTWLSARCGYVSDEVINLRRTFDIESIQMSRDLRQVNSDWSKIHASMLATITMQKAAG